jgi:hypothetical protein
MLGYQWLSDRFSIKPVQAFAISSRIASARSSVQVDGLRMDSYPEPYRPKDIFRDHLVFALKYQALHLEFLARLFALPQIRVDLEDWIVEEPTGRYARRACFLYEWLISTPLDLRAKVSGNYVDFLDPAEYVAGEPVNCPRWRVRDNLPGSPDFCPLVRRTEAVAAIEALDIAALLTQLEAECGAELIQRSAVWLTIRESRASYLIEHEHEADDRVRRFAAVIEQECGRETQPLSAERLLRLQRGILGANALRYGVRQSPVYVGHSAHYEQVVDYIAPHWGSVAALLDGLAQVLERTRGQSSAVRAALASFGFVYIHPMADGNGRISRFLINDILRRDGVVTGSIILPVSASITHSDRDRVRYDEVLELFSKPLMRHYAGQYHFGELETAPDGLEYNLHFDAYQDALAAWRYPDLTAHVAYLGEIIRATLQDEIRTQARYLKANDSARYLIKNIFEAPDSDLDRMIRSIRQNGNVVSNQLKKRYPVFATEELCEAVVQCVLRAFEGV